jgi:hypothetical protein
MLELDHIAKVYGPAVALLIRGLRSRYGMFLPADVEAPEALHIRDAAVLTSRIREHELSLADLRHPAIISALPATWWRDFQDHHANLARRTLVRVGEMGMLSNVLERAGFEVRFWKGPMLSMLLYGDLTTRPTRDIDLLIRPQEIIPIRKLLLSLGYQDDQPLRESGIRYYMLTHREWGMHKTTTEGMTHHLELQQSPVMSWSLSHKAEEMAFSDRRLVCLGKFQLPVPDPETHLMMLSAHHGLADGWRQLRHVSDMAAFLSLLAGQINAERLCELSGRYSLSRTLKLGLALANSLTGVSVPAPFNTRTGQEERYLQQLTRRLLEHPIPPKSEESVAAIRWQWRMSDDAQARRILISGHIRKWLAPGYEELLHVDLPPSLSFLYTPLKVMRPFRRLFRSA